ncbi:MAG: lamin tail domain-containing protein, partial [Candidatus Promineifilaceae bacterium]
MLRQKFIYLLCLLLVSGLFLTACESEDRSTVTPASATAVPTPNSPAPAEPVADAPALQTEGIFFSELLPGVPGGNSLEFVELYNAGSEPVDLQGWSVFYLLGEGQEQSLV